MSKIIGIDPGPTHSAFVIWDTEEEMIIKKSEPHRQEAGGLKHATENNFLCDLVANKSRYPCSQRLLEQYDYFAIEMIASYGMPVGKSVFDTAFWIGRFYESAGPRCELRCRLYRKEIVVHHCGNPRAKDGNVARALKDRYGEPGTKKNPGTTYGLAGDTWQAFAVAIALQDKLKLNKK